MEVSVKKELILCVLYVCAICYSQLFVRLRPLWRKKTVRLMQSFNIVNPAKNVLSGPTESVSLTELSVLWRCPLKESLLCLYCICVPYVYHVFEIFIYFHIRVPCISVKICQPYFGRGPGYTNI